MNRTAKIVAVLLALGLLSQSMAAPTFSYNMKSVGIDSDMPERLAKCRPKWNYVSSS